MTSETTLISDHQAVLTYYPDFCQNLHFPSLLSSIPWTQNQVFLFGKYHQEPRLTAWCGPPYTYSGLSWPETPWLSDLEQLKNQLNTSFDANFNAVLCNLYRSGKDGMGWHSDNEPEIDQSLIASISLGESRSFRVRSLKDRTSTGFKLENGSLLLMKHFQQDWQHCVPKSTKIMGPRINLTFRHIKVQKSE